MLRVQTGIVLQSLPDLSSEVLEERLKSSIVGVCLEPKLLQAILLFNFVQKLRNRVNLQIDFPLVRQMQVFACLPVLN